MCPTQIRGEINKTYTGHSPPPPPPAHDAVGEESLLTNQRPGMGAVTNQRAGSASTSGSPFVGRNYQEPRKSFGHRQQGQTGETGACINIP